jgi:hypothetical protein
MRFAEWDKGGRGPFLKRVHALMAEADIIVGHNLDNADVPWLKGDFYLPRIGHPHRPNLKPLPPFKTVDTLKVLRKEFKSGAPFKGLDAFCQIVGIPARPTATTVTHGARGRRVGRGPGAAHDYCEGDVIAGQWIYDWERRTSRTTRRCSLTGRRQARHLPCVWWQDIEADRQAVRRRRVHLLDAAVRTTVRLARSAVSIEPERMSDGARRLTERAEDYQFRLNLRDNPWDDLKGSPDHSRQGSS